MSFTYTMSEPASGPRGQRKPGVVIARGFVPDADSVFVLLTDDPFRRWRRRKNKTRKALHNIQDATAIRRRRARNPIREARRQAHLTRMLAPKLAAMVLEALKQSASNVYVA